MNKMFNSGIQLISRTKLTIFILIIFWLSHGFTTINCCSDIFSNHIGTTTNDMVIKEGDPMEVDCSLLTSSMDLGNGTKVKIDSQMLLFKYNGTRIQNSKIQIVDNSTIKYKVKRSSMKESGYYMCYIDIGYADVKPRAVCGSYITIAHAPSANDYFNLTCSGLDLKNFTCQWDLQSYNVATDYQLSLIIHEKFNYSTCPNRISRNTCSFTTRDPYPYLISDKKLRFRLDVSNKFGSIYKIYDIDHYSNVILDSISSLNFISSGSQNITISWDPPNSIADDPYLENITEYLLNVIPIHGDENSTHIDDIKQMESPFTKTVTVKGIRELKLEDLIPFTKYRFEIRCRLVTDAGKSKWSKELVDFIQTEPDVPYYCPILLPGGYEIIKRSDTRFDAIVYYEKVDEIYSNGPDFMTIVKTVPVHLITKVTSLSLLTGTIDSPISIAKRSEHHSKIFPTRSQSNKVSNILAPISSKPSIIVPGAPFPPTTNFINPQFSSLHVKNLSNTFDLKLTMLSMNSLGLSRIFNFIAIPSLSLSKVHPGVDSIYAIKWNDNNYTLYWTVSSVETIRDFSIFWCEVIDTPQCDHQINHVSAPKELDSVYLTINYNKVQFGISVMDSVYGVSSGIKWNQCIEDSSIIQTKNRFKRFNLISIGSKSVLANWLLDCPALDHFLYKFEIHYCKLSHPCSETLTIINVDKLLNELLIENLESNTGYNFTIYAVTKVKGQRLESSPITIETKVNAVTIILTVSVIIGLVILILTILYILLIFTIRKRKVERKLKETVDSNWIPKMPSRLKGDANILLNPLARETRNEYENKEYMNSGSNTNLNKLITKGFNSRFDQQLTKDCKNNVFILSTISGNNQLTDIIPCTASSSSSSSASSSVSPSSSSSSSITGEPDEGLELTCSIGNNEKIVANRKSLIKSFSSVSSTSSRRMRCRKLSDGGGCDSEDSGYSTKLSDKTVYYEGDKFTMEGLIKSIDENSPYIVVPEDKNSGISIGNNIKSSDDININQNNVNLSLSDSNLRCNDQIAINDDYNSSLPLRNEYLPFTGDYHYYLHGNIQNRNHNEPDDVNTISNGYVYT